MSKQWGHGYHAGFGDGAAEGLNDGCQKYAAWSECEQMNLLIELMARIIGEEPGPRHWALLRLMSEINSKNMFNPDRAWHNSVSSSA